MHITLEEEERELLVVFVIGTGVAFFLLLTYRIIRRSTSRLLTPIVGLGLISSQSPASSGIAAAKRGGARGTQPDVFVTPSKTGNHLNPARNSAAYDILQTIYLSPSRVALSLRRVARRIAPEEWGTSFGLFPVPHARVWLDSPWAMAIVEGWYAKLSQGGDRMEKSPRLGDFPVFEVGRERKASNDEAGRRRSTSMPGKESKIDVPKAARHPSNLYGRISGLSAATEGETQPSSSYNYVTPTRESSNPMDSLLITNSPRHLSVPRPADGALLASSGRMVQPPPISRSPSPDQTLSERRSSPVLRSSPSDDDEEPSSDEDGGVRLFVKKETRSISPVSTGLVAMQGGVHIRSPIVLPPRLRSNSNSHVHQSTTNEKHDDTTFLLKSPPNSYPASNGATLGKRQRAIKAFYTVGCAVAVVGMLIAISLVTWQAFSSWWGIYRVVVSRVTRARSLVGEAVVTTTETISRKRSVAPLILEHGSERADPATMSSKGLQFASGWKWSTGGGMGGFTGSVIQPIIPGLTVPLTHLIPLLLALFSSQIVHELGHIVAAAVDGIHPVQITATLHLVLPSASVLLPSSVTSLPSLSRTRMAAAGPWHNLANFLVLALVGWSGVTRVFYNDFTSDGRVVLSLQGGSPLEGHLPAGSVIEYLDDVAVGGVADVWSQYLLSDEQDDARGWCVDKKRYQATLRAPCPKNAPIEFTAYPFTNQTEEIAHCLPAYPLLTTRTWSCPCSSHFQVCVKPTPASNVLRIQWIAPQALSLSRQHRSSSVLLWSGARDEVWRSVRVSRYAGRGGWIGRRFAIMVELLCSYVSTLSLTLFLLNLLPVPSLDGAHILEALLDYQYPNTRSVKDRSESSNLDAGVFATELELVPGGDDESMMPRSRPSEDHRTRRRLQYLVSFGTAALVAMSLGGMVVALGLQLSG